jgi:hypothetical protein
MENAVKTLLRNLKEWKNLPSYQAERRMDLLLSVHIREFLEYSISKNHGEIKLSGVFIPEFPLPKHVLVPGYTYADSKRVDYFFISEDFKKVVFVELKTDAKSVVDVEQIKYLTALLEVKFTDLVKGIKKAYKNTDENGKYFHLFGLLQKVGVITSIPEELKCVPDNSKALYLEQILDRVQFAEIDPEIIVCYIAPARDFSLNPNFTQLTLSEYCDFLKSYKSNDAFAVLLAEFLDELYPNPIIGK